MIDTWQHMVDLPGMLAPDCLRVHYLQPAALGDALTSRLFTVSSEAGDTLLWAPRLHLRPHGSDIFHTAIFTRANQYLRKVHSSRRGRTHATQTIRATAESLVCRCCMVRHASLMAACIHSLCITHCRVLKQASTAVSVI